VEEEKEEEEEKEKREKRKEGNIKRFGEISV